MPFLLYFLLLGRKGFLVMPYLMSEFFSFPGEAKD
jgi:hypothetical protein